jgi:hypothetical protein
VFHNLAVGMNGSVRTWGWNGAGALGTGDTADRLPVLLPGTSAAVGGAGGVHSLVG